jgi:sporulation integral membrane protein YtvI
MEQRELTWKERGRLWMRLGIRLILTAAALLVLYFVARPLLSLFMPFVLALVMAWLLNPLVRWLHRKLKISRRVISLLLILLVFAVAGGILFGFFYGIASEIYSLVTDWTSVEGDILGSLNAIGARLQHFADRLPERLPPEVGQWADGLYERLLTWFQDVAPQLLTSMGKGAGNFAMSVPSWVVAAVVFLMASYFITADYPRIRFLFTEHMSGEIRDFLGRVRDVAVGALGGYVKAQLLLSLGVFFILVIGLSVIRQNYALLLAFLLAVMDFIPIIGAGTAMVPWAVVDLVTGDYRKAIELMVIWGIICLFRRVAEPKVVGGQTGLSPVLSLVSIYVGMRIAGFWGMVLGPVALLIAINIVKMGVFSNVARDVRLAAHDIRALLAAKEDKADPGDSKKLKNPKDPEDP